MDTRTIANILLLCCAIPACDRQKTQKHEAKSAAHERQTTVTPPPAMVEIKPGTNTEVQGPVSRREVDAVVALTDAEERRSGLEDLVMQNATSDLDLACLAYAALRKEFGAPRLVTEYLAAALAELDQDAALAWAETLERGENRRIAYSSLALRVADTSPPHAAQMATAHLPLNSEYDRVFVEIANRWSATDPMAAANWMVRFPEGDARNKGLAAVFGAWSDPTAVSQWIGGIGDPPARQQARVSLASVVSTLPTATKQQWLGAFQDTEDLREMQKLLNP